MRKMITAGAAVVVGLTAALHGTSTVSGRPPKKKPWPAFTAAWAGQQVGQSVAEFVFANFMRPRARWSD